MNQVQTFSSRATAAGLAVAIVSLSLPNESIATISVSAGRQYNLVFNGPTHAIQAAESAKDVSEPTVIVVENNPEAGMRVEKQAAFAIALFAMMASLFAFGSLAGSAVATSAASIMGAVGCFIAANVSKRVRLAK